MENKEITEFVTALKEERAIMNNNEDIILNRTDVDKILAIIDQLLEENKKLEEQRDRFLSGINELQKRLTKYEPDNCQICHGKRGGVRGNENVIDGVVMCDYCHADKIPAT